MSEREILFRGKRFGDGEWIEGYFLPGNERQSLHPRIFVYLPETQSFECFDIDIDTLGEYTGLTDKNGLTKIFEGDIVAYDYFCGVVYFHEGTWCVTEEDNYPDYLYDLIDLKIIGNIHDNPELLKGD